MRLAKANFFVRMRKTEIKNGDGSRQDKDSPIYSLMILVKLCFSLVVCFKTWSKRLLLVAFHLTRCAQFSGEVHVVKMLLSHRRSSLVTEM